MMIKILILTANIILLFPLLAFAANGEDGSEAFAYVRLIVETITSPQIIILGIIVLLLIKRPKILDRLSMLDIAGVKLELSEIKEVVEQTKSNLQNVEEKLDIVRKDYIESAEQFDPISSATDIDKLGTYLKSVAASLDSIDFVADHLNVSSSQGQVYAAACAIQVRPQPKFLEPVSDYLGIISAKSDLNGIRLRVAYKLVQCMENILRSDNKKANKVLSDEIRIKAQEALRALSQHPWCVSDDAENGSRGIVHRINRALKLIKA